MSRTTHTLGFSVPPALAKEVSSLAKEERRTKSELFREMLRVYRRYRADRDREEECWVMRIVEEAKAEQAKNPLSVEDILSESERISRYGASQARKLGIKPKDVNRIVHEYRQSQRA